MAKYKPVTATAALEIIDGIAEFKTSVNEAGVKISNIALNAGAQESRRLTPVRKKPYPPSRDRIPGTMRRSIRTVPATLDHPGKNIMQSWLWEWIEGWNKRNIAAGGKLKRHRNAGKNKGISRFKKMIKTDPRRLLGEPMEREIGRRTGKQINKLINEAIERASK